MLIPSIDLMGGKVVQLVQGRRKALEFDDWEQWVDRFEKYSLVQLIDLDAAIGTGSNAELVGTIAKRLRCQVGGGIRTLEAARNMLDAGARRVIVGSSLFKGVSLNPVFAEVLSTEVGAERLVFALDAMGGRVTIHGWRTATQVTPMEMVRALSEWCGAFLYTHVETEGSLGGFPREVIRPLRQATRRQLIGAGGIRSQEEIDELEAMGVDAVVGMAVYRGMVKA